jgi:hypothetical protein
MWKGGGGTLRGKGAAEPSDTASTPLNRAASASALCMATTWVCVGGEGAMQSRDRVMGMGGGGGWDAQRQGCG